MVSTYLAYNSIVRNLRQSMTHVAQQTDVSRNAAYYKDNIGKVKTVDDFLKNDRLYQWSAAWRSTSRPRSWKNIST